MAQDPPRSRGYRATPLAIGLLVLASLLAGCLASPQEAARKDPTASDAPPGGDPTTFEWSTRAKLGDAGVRFTAVGAASCELTYELSGYADSSEPLYLRGVWAAGEVAEGRISVGQDIPSVRVHRGTVRVVERGTSDRGGHWEVRGKMSNFWGDGPGRTVYTLAGRGLEAPRADDGVYTNDTINVSLSCNHPVEIKEVRAISDLRLFSYQTMRDGTGAYARRTAGAVWNGSVQYRVDAPSGELVFQAGRANNGYGRVRAATPGGTETYVVQPYIGEYDPLPFTWPHTPHRLPAGPGDYRIRADYAGYTGLHGFYGGVLGLEPVPSLDELPRAIS